MGIRDKPRHEFICKGELGSDSSEVLEGGSDEYRFKDVSRDRAKVQLRWYRYDLVSS